MVSPPTSLPSPTPSSSSYPRPSFSSLPPPPRTASTSTASSRSHFPSGSISNGYPPDMYSAPPPAGASQQYQGGIGGYYDDPNHTPSAPPPNHLHPHPPHVPSQNPHSAVFLPPVSSSPPPMVPQYVPPPQHQMAPDPIHHLNQLQQQRIPVGPGGTNGWGWRPPLNPPGMGQYPYRPGQGQGQNGGQEYRGGSQPGRDRRRREREEEGGQDEEVITTIFVVGFPDDMLEREFQNIFTFAPGFEAATLKFPSGRSREPTAALLAELTHLASLREARSRDPSAGSSEDPHDPQIAQQQAALEEALANLHIPPIASHTATTSTSTTPSALTPSVLTPGPGITRRQTIGFARFKTRPDALAAREQLQGRKIDYLTGATLKAEMAKKNLHTKRTTSGEELVGLLLRSGRLAGLVGGLREGSVGRGEGREGYAQGNGSGGGGSASAREAWEAWPGVQQQQQQQGGTDLNNRDLRQYPATEDFSHVQYQHQQPLPPARSSFSQPTNPGAYSAFNPQANLYSNNYNPLHPVSSHSTGPTSPPLSTKSPVPPPGPSTQDSKALLALAEETDELDLEMEWNAYGAGGGQDYTPRRPERAYAGGMMGYGMNNGYNGPSGQGQIQQRGDLGTSPSATSDALSETGRSIGNPADQNPPINTLYVGNLPAISPPTHPPNFLEESLRALFQRLPGFKRMSFRQKINGPMCFVEFEDVGYATLAIKEMYGCNLNGLVKGGIRLSYSKNSLGQRGHSHASGQNSSMFGGIAHTVALAGMSNNPGPNHTHTHTHSQSFSSLGLSHTQSSQTGTATSIRDGTTLSPTAQPFTIPTNNNSSSSSTGSGSNYATSPRSRYFSSPPNSNVNAQAQATSPTSFTSFAPSSANSYTGIPNGNANANANANGNGNGPVSPKPLPNFSWVSTGTGTGSIGNGYSATAGGGFDGFPSSLGGVASTWGSRASG